MPNHYYKYKDEVYLCTNSAPRGIHFIKTDTVGGVFFSHEEFENLLAKGEVVLLK